MQLDVNIVLKKLKEQLSEVTYSKVLLDAQVEQMSNQISELQQQVETLQGQLSTYQPQSESEE